MTPRSESRGLGARVAATVLCSLLLALGSPAWASADAGDSKPVQLGAYVDGMQGRPAMLEEFERLIGGDVGIASVYRGLDESFPAELETELAADGRRKVLVSWHLDGTRFSEWAAGKHDDRLDRLAAAAEAYPHKLWVRPWAEMNGDWQPFQPTATGDRPDGGTYREFRQAWRHVVRYLRDQGVTNLRWVFNPTADTYAETTPVEKIWPGRRHVDVLGIDGFNWGEDDRWGRWQSFDRVFGPMYERLTALAPRSPVWICEFGSKEPRTDDGAPPDDQRRKGPWMRRALDRSSMPRVKAMILFQAKKERDWRVESSPGSLRAIRGAMAARG